MSSLANHRFRRSSTVAFAMLCFATVPGFAQVQGDSAAVSAIERLLVAIGGRAAWATGRTLQLRYRGWQALPTHRLVTELAWRDMEEPNQRMEVRPDTGGYVVAFTTDDGWWERNDTTHALSDDQLVRERLFWQRDFYTLLGRLARADPDLWVESANDLRVVVVSRSQGEIGWFEIASDGTPIRWGTMDGGEPLEYVYGPLRDFGPLKFPAWGASLDGSWRFEYEEVALRAGPIPAELLARPAASPREPSI